MSEIKGQLLGIVLTIAIFGIVFAAMTITFKSVSDAISKKAIDAVTTSSEPAPSTSQVKLLNGDMILFN